MHGERKERKKSCYLMIQPPCMVGRVSVELKFLKRIKRARKLKVSLVLRLSVRQAAHSHRAS